MVSGDMDVAACVESTYEIDNVTANVEGRIVDLTFNNCGHCYPSSHDCRCGWIGKMSLSGIEKGPKLLTVTATDVFGNSGDDTLPFQFDMRPVLKVIEPLPETVATPYLHVKAECIDDDPSGCVFMTVSTEPNTDRRMLAKGETGIDTDIYLGPHSGRSVTLKVVATDTNLQTAQSLINLYAESSDKLVPYENVLGKILDVSGNRILFIDKIGPNNALEIWNVTTKKNSTLLDDPNQEAQYGFLTEKGAIFVAYIRSQNKYGLYEHRDGSLIEHSTAFQYNSLDV